MRIAYLVNSWKESYELQKKLLDKGYEWEDGIAINPKAPVCIPIGDYGTVIFNLSDSKLLNYRIVNSQETFLFFQEELSGIKKSKKLSI